MTVEEKGRSGRLVLVATPIGNLGDLSPRAREVLAAADLLCCEDNAPNESASLRHGHPRRRSAR